MYTNQKQKLKFYAVFIQLVVRHQLSSHLPSFVPFILLLFAVTLCPSLLTDIMKHKKEVRCHEYCQSFPRHFIDGLLNAWFFFFCDWTVIIQHYNYKAVEVFFLAFQYH